MVERLANGSVGDLVEDDTAHLIGVYLCGLHQVPGDGFAFAVGVGGEVYKVGRLGGFGQLGDYLSLVGH